MSPSAAVITNRAFYPNTNDVQRGQGLNNFLTNLQAVAQAIDSSLQLLRGEWFLNLSAGLPLFQSILGVSSTTNGVGLIIRQQILTVPYTINVINMVVTYTGSNRNYTFSCDVITNFGTITLQSQPLPGVSST